MTARLGPVALLTPSPGRATSSARSWKLVMCWP